MASQGMMSGTTKLLAMANVQASKARRLAGRQRYNGEILRNRMRASRCELRPDSGRDDAAVAQPARMLWHKGACVSLRLHTCTGISLLCCAAN